MIKTSRRKYYVVTYVTPSGLELILSKSRDAHYTLTDLEDPGIRDACSFAYKHEAVAHMQRLDGFVIRRVRALTVTLQLGSVERSRLTINRRTKRWTM